ncbi:MAG TPA: alpha/beta fold hydrolase, partial [Alphaproteobacteria bacterium]|nr:alpha/beta fold hydrolase [Alphaproteobacteria bacterium]
MRNLQIDGPRQPAAGGGSPRQLVVLLHGYGADGNDLIGLAPYLARLLPHAYFVAPNAPEPCGMAPTGYQWFPIGSFDEAERRRGVEAAAPLLDSFLDRELQRHGLDERSLALVGFSQGTMMSLHVGLRRPRPVAGIVGFSGALVAPERLAEEVTAAPPILLVHGDADDLLPHVIQVHDSNHQAVSHQDGGEDLAPPLDDFQFMAEFHLGGNL